MKDNLQNIADLIGALAEDIEGIKKKQDAKDSPDKDEALDRLASVVRLCSLSCLPSVWCNGMSAGKKTGD